MSDEGGKAKAIPWSEDDKLSMVVRLLFHQGPIKWDGFDIRTGHTQRAVGGVLDRLKKKYVTDAAAGEAVATTKNDDPKPKTAEKKGKKSTRIAKKDVEAEVKDKEADGELAAEAPVEKKKRERKPSKKATESTEPAKLKTPALEASSESKGTKRGKPKTPGAEPKGKRAKTEVEA